MLRTAVIGLLLFIVAQAVPELRKTVADRSTVPTGWKLGKIARPETMLSYTLLLNQKNQDVIDNIFQSVSDPDDPNWGKFLTAKELYDIIRPDDAVFQEIEQWLQPFVGPELSYTVYPSCIMVKSTVRVATKLFESPFHEYHDIQTSKAVIRSHGQMSIPALIAKHVSLVLGLSEFFTSKAHYTPQQAQRVEGADITVTPSVLKEYYNVPSNLVGTNKNNLMAVLAFDDYYSKGALASFDQDQNIPAPNITRIGPDCSPNCDEYESDLDVQYMTAMGEGVPSFFISQGNNYWILQTLLEIIYKLPAQPRVVSISYGWAELEQCDIAVANCDKLGYSAKKYVEVTNQAFQNLGTVGVTALVSDGDDGAPSLGGASGNCPIDPSIYCPSGGCAHTSTQCNSITVQNVTSGDLCFIPMGLGSDACSIFLSDTNSNNALSQFLTQNTNCQLNLEQDRGQMPHVYSTCSCSQLQSVTAYGYKMTGYTFNKNNGAVFTADYPTSSPYVTSVGATQFLSQDGKTISEEVVCSILTGAAITTGGGFSTFQPQPDYQKDAVANYLAQNKNLPPSFSYNPSMRGYPDITMNGHNYRIFYSDGSTDSCPCSATAVDGTSCSSPAFAGLVSLINDQLLNAGKPALGFLNPLLYKMAKEEPSAFNDVTKGDNKCNRAYCCLYGWETGAGWDPVTGLGSPNVENMLNYILKKRNILQ